MQKRILFILFVSCVFIGFSQDTQLTKKRILKGKIINNVDSKPLQSADILNLKFLLLEQLQIERVNFI